MSPELTAGQRGEVITAIKSVARDSGHALGLWLVEEGDIAVARCRLCGATATVDLHTSSCTLSPGLTTLCPVDPRRI